MNILSLQVKLCSYEEAQMSLSLWFLLTSEDCGEGKVSLHYALNNSIISNIYFVLDNWHDSRLGCKQMEPPGCGYSVSKDDLNSEGLHLLCPYRKLSSAITVCV